MKNAIFSAALAASSALVAPAVAETELSFNIFLPQTHFAWDVFRGWADDVSEATGGEVRITFPAQSVAPPPGIMDAVRNGVADGGFIFNGFIAKSNPGAMLTQMPWMSLNDSEAMSTVLWDTYEETFGPVEDWRGVHLVSMFHLGPTYLCSVTDTPITTLEDLKGRRVFALPGTIADTLSDMGLAIVAAPAVQVQELTSRNTVDAHLGLTMETIVSFGVAPYTKSCVEMSPALQSANFSIFFNQRAWDRLTDDQRAAIDELSGTALAARLGAATDSAEAVARAELEAQGITFTPMDAGLLEAMEASAAKTSAAWEEAISSAYGIDATALIEETRAAVAEASGK